MLTINIGEGAQTTFAPSVVTPSLASIVASKNGRGLDLRQVVLDGASVAGVDFTAARFGNASAVGTDFSGCMFMLADLQCTVLIGAKFTNAVLDQANLTNATLGAPGWGEPASAKGVVLNNCRARGAALGGKNQLDCTGAQLAGGDFAGADLYGLQLCGARLANAILTGCRLDKAVLDGADLTGVFALRASFKNACLRNITGQNANFTSADFSSADLSQARLGAKDFLFTLAASNASELQKPYPDQALQSAFATHGFVLSPQAPITILVPSQRWQIDDQSKTYLLIASGEGIDVFHSGLDARPAVLRNAVLLDAKASGAGLAGADLHGVQWHGNKAMLDRADLEDAALSGSLLVSVNFDQAFLSGADLSNSVLVQAKIRGCTIVYGASGRAFSLEGAQIQGADFSDTTIIGGLLIDAGVALEQGVPLFALPQSALDDLTPAGIANLAPLFAEAGYVLGAAPSITATQSWIIDNHDDPDTSAPTSYLVRRIEGQLHVFNGAGDTPYFTLSLADEPLLRPGPPAPQLIKDFYAEGFGLAETAVIANVSQWRIAPSAGAGLIGPYGYAAFRVLPQADVLQVFGWRLLLLRDWRQYDNGIGFLPSSKLESALGPTCIGPAGYPVALLQSLEMDPEVFFSTQR